MLRQLAILRGGSKFPKQEQMGLAALDLLTRESMSLPIECFRRDSTGQDVLSLLISLSLEITISFQVGRPLRPSATSLGAIELAEITAAFDYVIAGFVSTLLRGSFRFTFLLPLVVVARPLLRVIVLPFVDQNPFSIASICSSGLAVQGMVLLVPVLWGKLKPAISTGFVRGFGNRLRYQRNSRRTPFPI